MATDVGLRAILEPDIDEQQVQDAVGDIGGIIDSNLPSLKPDIDTSGMVDKLKSALSTGLQGAGALGQILGAKGLRRAGIPTTIPMDNLFGGGDSGGSSTGGEKTNSILREQLSMLEEIYEELQNFTFQQAQGVGGGGGGGNSFMPFGLGALAGGGSLGLGASLGIGGAGGLAALGGLGAAGGAVGAGFLMKKLVESLGLEDVSNDDIMGAIVSPIEDAGSEIAEAIPGLDSAISDFTSGVEDASDAAYNFEEEFNQASDDIGSALDSFISEFTGDDSENGQDTGDGDGDTNPEDAPGSERWPFSFVEEGGMATSITDDIEEHQEYLQHREDIGADRPTGATGPLGTPEGRNRWKEAINAAMSGSPGAGGNTSVEDIAAANRAKEVMKERESRVNITNEYEVKVDPDMRRLRQEIKRINRQFKRDIEDSLRSPFKDKSGL